MDAIIYTSNSGYTAEYARLLGEQTGLKVYNAKESLHSLKPKSSVIYLGWLMAGKVMGYSKISKKYNVRCVVGVGMASYGSQLEEVKKGNKINDIPVFVLQGGFNINKLHGIYKFMMNTMKRTAGAALLKKQDRTAEEEDMLDLMMNGGSRVNSEDLKPIIELIQKEH